jgi:hypothetical protein
LDGKNNRLSIQNMLNASGSVRSTTVNDLNDIDIKGHAQSCVTTYSSHPNSLVLNAQLINHLG